MLKTVSSVINAIGALNYQGTWNASANSPALASGVGTKGDYYVVSVAGSTNLDGITDWQIGDWAVFNGTVWQKIDNTDGVVSVNGQTGVVVLTSFSNVTLNNATINGVTNALVTKTANYTATTVDCTILGNAATGNITITLPTAASVAGRFYVVKKIDSTANTVTVATTSAQTIDGQASKVLSIQYDGIQVQSDNANWVIISNTFGRNGTAGSF